MIVGNINTYRSCGMSTEALDKYIEFLKTVSADTPKGKYTLEDGTIYYVSEITQMLPSEKPYESHKKYIDIQFILSGTEDMEYADITAVTETEAYNDEDDAALHEGDGIMLTLKPGDFVVFAPMDAHKPGCGTGNSKKVIIKVPVE